MNAVSQIRETSNVVPLRATQTDSAVEPTSAAAASTRPTVRIVVDASCDLPAEWIAAHDIVVLPIRLEVGDWSILDTRDPFTTREFFHKEISNRGVSAQSVPLSTEAVREFVEPYVENGLTGMVQITVAAARSKIYLNSLAAAQHLTLSVARTRRDAGGSGLPFQMSVIDSENFFSGQALLAAYAAHSLDMGMSLDRLLVKLTQLRRHIHSLAVPNDLYYIYKRARLKGERSIGWGSYKLGAALEVKPILYANQGVTTPLMKVRRRDAAQTKALDAVVKEIERGALLAPFVCVSYAGPLEEITSLPSYRMLRIACTQHRVELLTAPMSMTGGLNVGPGALAISVASRSPLFLKV